LETAHDKLNIESFRATDANELQSQLSKNKEFFQDLASQQTLLNDLAEKVDSSTRQRYRAPHTRLNNLARGIYDKAHDQDLKVQRLVGHWSDFEPRIDKKSTRIDELTKQLPRGPEPNDSAETLEKKLKDAKVVQRLIDDERGSVSRTVDKGRDILRGIDCPSFESKVNELDDKFQTLDKKINSDVKKLNKLVDQNKQFTADTSYLETWLQCTESAEGHQ